MVARVGVTETDQKQRKVMTHAIQPTSQCILSATAIAAVLGALVSPAHAGVAEQALARANAKVQAAIVHDVCEVHSTEARDQLDIDDRAAYASILKELQQTLDSSADPEVATQKFCEFGLGLPKPPGRA